MQIEKVEIWITCDKPIETDGTPVRGFLGNMYRNRQEFHGHREDKLIYKHPLIQYKVFGGSALVIGLKEGAYLLKALPKLDHLEIYHQKYPVIKQNSNTESLYFGLTENTISYSFVAPWIGLNTENYKEYLRLRKRQKDARVLLEKILIGNILSISKAIGYVVEGKIQVKVNLQESQTVDIKDGVELMAFQGEFETNFLIPDFWGIGKFSSRGYGTVRCINGGNPQ